MNGTLCAIKPEMKSTSSRACRRLAIKRLEKQLGGALFLRRPCVEPTPLAVALKPYFEQILLSPHLARHEANRILAKKSGPHRSAGAKTSASVAVSGSTLKS